MNKFLSYVNLSLELHVVSTFWLGSDTSGTFSLHFAQLILWCRTDICSSKFSAKVSLILDNPFLVPSLCKLNHISLCFIQISTKSLANCLFPSGKAMFFWSHSRCFGPLGKFQYNIKISLKTARVSRLFVSGDYDIKQYLWFKKKLASFSFAEVQP